MLGNRIAADLVVTFHVSYIAFVVLGMLAILVGIARGWAWVRNPRFRVAHLVAIAIVAVQALLGVACPLTTLENALRLRAGQATYPGAFIGYWAHRLTSPGAAVGLHGRLRAVRPGRPGSLRAGPAPLAGRRPGGPA